MRIIIYARVSTINQKDSITNQLVLAREWIDNNIFGTRGSYNKIENVKGCWKNDVNIEEIVDVGYSGSTMNRPGIEKIIKMIDSNKAKTMQVINILVVKDISRIGRNYIEVGNFIRRLEATKIQLVCINSEENIVDLENGGICTDIDSIMADFYSKDISIKTKSILDMNKRKGVYSISKVPFGYRKSKLDKHIIEVHEIEASIVRFIYEKYNKGEKIKDIVCRLNNKEYVEKNEVNKYKEIAEKEWNYQRVYSILNNEFYKGTMVYGKTKGHIWEGKKRVYLDKKDWIRIENHHDAII